MKKHLQLLLHVTAIGLFAFGLRHTGWNWDQGSPWSLHPDERHMVSTTLALNSEGGWFNTDTSGMNPYNQGVQSYVYGTLPLHLTHALTVERGITERREVIRVGRFLSACWSTGTVLLLYLFTLRIAGPRTASIAGILMAATVLAIQQAHFYTVDSPGVFFTVLCIGLGIESLRKQQPGFLMASAAVVGLAMACRLNLGLLAFWVTGLAILSAWQTRRIHPLVAWMGGGVLALVLFRIFQPYAFEASGIFPRGLNPKWLTDLETVHAISSGELEVPFTLQWIKRIPWLNALYQLVAWGMGWPLGIAGVLSTGWILWTKRTSPADPLFLLALWPVLLIGYHGGVFLHTLRYFLPTIPILILICVLTIRQLEPLELRRILFGVVLVPTLLYAAAFLHIYREPHSRVEASQWLYQQLPYGGIVASEHWDDALPLRIPGAEEVHAKFDFRELQVYDPETPEKLEQILQTIEEADYLILSSTRASFTLPRFAERYPVMSRFYTRLEEGASRSGLRQVARFHTVPQLGGWGLDSLRAEEVYRVYDHPLVRIYEKTPVFSVDALRTVLTEDLDFSTIPDIRYRDAGKWNNGWLTETEWSKRQSDTSWSERFPPNGIGNQAPLLTWILVLVFLGFIAVPITYLAFPSLADRGWAVSRPVSLLLITFLAWLPAAWGLLPFGVGIGAATLLLVVVSGVRIGLHHEELLEALRTRKRSLIAEEAVFWSVFILVGMLRWLQPDLWHPWSGGEKPMDFAFLNAIAQSDYFPAPQPWLSGGAINYYDYGFIWVATLIRATGISPDIAYNLAIPTFAAFAASILYTLAGCGVSAFRSGPGRPGKVLPGVLAVLLVLFIGNLGQLRWYLSDRTDDFSNAGYWNASRVIGVPEGDIQPITEFPFFTFLYGDLHAHLMALPMAMLAMLCSWQLWRRPHILRLGLCGLALGSLWITNAWDFPVQAAIFAFCCLARILSRPREQWIASTAASISWILIGLVLAKLLFLPAHWKGLAHPAEFEAWAGPRSPLSDLIMAHGIQLLPLLLLAGLLISGWTPWRKSSFTGRAFWLLCLAGCLTLILLVEFVRLKSDIGRMNTVFKFYYQVWWILGLVQAVMIGPILTRLDRQPQRFALLGVSALLWLAGALYPLTAPAAKIRDRFWLTDDRGWNGLAYLEEAELHLDGTVLPLSSDLAGIHWLREQVPPFTVLMEAHRPEYQWGARMSWHTGLPTVLGWNWHMRQQRPRDGADRVIWRRAEEVRRFYTTLDPESAQDILTRYQVRFVIAGDLENLTYGEGVQKRFNSWPFLEKVFEQDGLAIYRVKKNL